MLEWKNVLQLVGSTLGPHPEGGVCILDFLRILPEEVTEGRKISLTVRARHMAGRQSKLQLRRIGRGQGLMHHITLGRGA